MSYSVEDAVPVVSSTLSAIEIKEPIGRILRRIMEWSPEYIIKLVIIGSWAVEDSWKWIDQATGLRLLNHFQKGFCEVNVAGWVVPSGKL